MYETKEMPMIQLNDWIEWIVELLFFWPMTRVLHEVAQEVLRGLTMTNQSSIVGQGMPSFICEWIQWSSKAKNQEEIFYHSRFIYSQVYVMSREMLSSFSCCDWMRCVIFIFGRSPYQLTYDDIVFLFFKQASLT